MSHLSKLLACAKAAIISARGTSLGANCCVKTCDTGCDQRDSFAILDCNTAYISGTLIAVPSAIFTARRRKGNRGRTTAAATAFLYAHNAKEDLPPPIFFLCRCTPADFPPIFMICQRIHVYD
jgi:hypothetical protein